VTLAMASEPKARRMGATSSSLRVSPLPLSFFTTPGENFCAEWTITLGSGSKAAPRPTSRR
jgi:hypothetical protein